MVEQAAGWVTWMMTMMAVLTVMDCWWSKRLLASQQQAGEQQASSKPAGEQQASSKPAAGREASASLLLWWTILA